MERSVIGRFYSIENARKLDDRRVPRFVCSWPTLVHEFSNRIDGTLQVLVYLFQLLGVTKVMGRSTYLSSFLPIRTSPRLIQTKRGFKGTIEILQSF